MVDPRVVRARYSRDPDFADDEDLVIEDPYGNEGYIEEYEEDPYEDVRPPPKRRRLVTTVQRVPAKKKKAKGQGTSKSAEHMRKLNDWNIFCHQNSIKVKAEHPDWDHSMVVKENSRAYAAKKAKELQEVKECKDLDVLAGKVVQFRNTRSYVTFQRMS